MKRRKQYRKTQGHRQNQTQILVTSIYNGSGLTSVLNENEKKEKLSRFHSLLKPKGKAFHLKKIQTRSEHSKQSKSKEK